MPLEEFSSFISCKLCDLRAAGMCDFAVYLQVWCEGRLCLRLVFFRPLSSLREGGTVLLDHLPAELAQCQLLFIQTEQTPALFRLPSLYNGSPITLPGRWAAHLPADMFTVLLLVSCKNAKACSRQHARGSLSELTPQQCGMFSVDLSDSGESEQYLSVAVKCATLHHHHHRTASRADLSMSTLHASWDKCVYIVRLGLVCTIALLPSFYLVNGQVVMYRRSHGKLPCQWPSV